jgi:ankyrin repeat protein
METPPGANQNPSHEAQNSQSLQPTILQMLDAANRGDTTRVLNALNQGITPNYVDHNGQSPLHMAARDGNVELVRLLIARGAFINVLDSTRVTPLHLAAANGHLDVVQILIRAGAQDSAVEGQLSQLSYAKTDAIRNLLLAARLN